MKKSTKIIIINIILLVLIAGVIIISQYRSKPAEVEQVTISFNTDGGKKVASKTIAKGETIKLPKTEKEGYTFGGWYLKNEKVADGTKFYQNVTLVAYWIEEDAETLTITFDTNGGSKIEPLVIECNHDLKLPVNPTKEGYEFISWLDSKENIVNNETKLPCENITLKAKWEEKVPSKKEELKLVEEKKEYTCPEGYTLEGTKCQIETEVKLKCSAPTKYDNGFCIMIIDYTQGIKTCKKITINTGSESLEVQGEYYIQGNEEYCGYYPQNIAENDCGEEVGIWANNKCYTETIKNNFNITCSEGYIYYSGFDIQNKFGMPGDDGCYSAIEPTKICHDDYILTDGRCIKTIDAELK